MLKKRLKIILIVTMLLFSKTLFLNCAVAKPLTLIDQTGKKTVIEKAAHKIIVFFPQAMAAVFVLDLTDRIIGFPDMKLHIKKSPENGFYRQMGSSLYNKPDIGYPGKPNIELMISLKPDLIIGPAHIIKSSKLLDKAGLKVISVYAGFDDHISWYEAVRLVSRACGCPEKAENYINACEEILDLVKKKTELIKLKKKALYLNSFMGKISIRGSRTKLARDILEMAGAETLSDGNDRGGNFNFSAESLFKFNPWAVFSMSFIGSDSGNRSSPFDKKVLKGISGLTALKENRYWIPPADDDSCWMTSWFGPNNFALGVLWTAKKLYPSLFQDISLNEAANEFYLKVYGLKRTSLPDHNCLK